MSLLRLPRRFWLILTLVCVAVGAGLVLTPSSAWGDTGYYLFSGVAFLLSFEVVAVLLWTLESRRALHLRRERVQDRDARRKRGAGPGQLSEPAEEPLRGRLSKPVPAAVTTVPRRRRRGMPLD